MSEELADILNKLGLQGYVPAFMNAGYDDWDTVGDMTESDFDALNIRLGDRRKLQREIARRQLWPENSPLPTPDELREFTLSLRDEVDEDSKTEMQQQEAEIVSSAQDTSPELVCSAESSKSLDSIPRLELDENGNGGEHACNSTDQVADEKYLSAHDANSDDDITPRANESGAVSPTSTEK